MMEREIYGIVLVLARPGGMLVLMMGHLGILFDDVFLTGAIS